MPALVWPPLSPVFAPSYGRGQHSADVEKRRRGLTSQADCSVLLYAADTDPLFGRSFSQPFGDDLEDVSCLTPATETVQQLAVLSLHGCWLQTPQPGQEPTAGEGERQSTYYRRTACLTVSSCAHLNVGTAAGGMKEASCMSGTVQRSSLREKEK